MKNINKILILIIFFTSMQLFADGCFFSYDKAELEEPSQKAVIHFNKDIETLILQVKYQGNAKDFSWVVPIPSKPEVKAVNKENNPFEELSYYTQRRIPRKFTGFLSADTNYGVKVIEKKKVGVYDITVLNASKAEALAVWLRKNGFTLPGKAIPVLKHYVKMKWYYVAMRINAKEISEDSEKKLKKGILQPIKFKFKTEKAVYPLRISSINKGETEVLLFVLADKPLKITDTMDKDGLSIDNNIPLFLDYVLRSEEVFQDRYYGTYTKCNAKRLPKTWSALGLDKKRDFYLCKYRTEFKTEEMKNDISFSSFNPIEYYKNKLEKVENLRTKWRLLSFLINHENNAKYSKLQIELLEEMSKSEDVFLCFIAANNPKTPKKCFSSLYLKDRDSIDWALADNPEIPSDILYNLLKNKRCLLPSKVIKHKNLSVKDLNKLAVDGSVEIRCAVASNSKCPVETLRKLLQSKDIGVCLAAAFNPSLPKEDFEVLTRHKSPSLRRELANFPRTTSNMLAEIVKGNCSSSIREDISKHPNLSDETMLVIARDINYKVRASLALRDDLTSKCIKILSEDDSEYVRESLAKNNKTPAEILEKLSKDKSEDVRIAVAGNSKITYEITHKLSKDSYSVRKELARSSTLPLDIIEILSKDSDSGVRKVIAENKKTPSKILSKFIKDSYFIRIAVARNPKTLPEDLTILSKDNEEPVRSRVAGNVNTPIDILEKLSNDDSIFVRKSVASNPNISTEIAVKLSQDDERVRVYLAGNPNLPLDIINRFTESKSTRILSSLAGNPKTPEKILFKLFKIGYQPIKKSLSENINTPIDILEKLTDGNNDFNGYGISECAKKTLKKKLKNIKNKK